jgi:multidrug efflux pump
MLVGTLFTLFVLPTVYTLLARNHSASATTLRARQLAEVDTCEGAAEQGSAS